MGMGTPTRNQLGFVEAYLDEYDAVLRQRGAAKSRLFCGNYLFWQDERGTTRPIALRSTF
jgi:hypothetical protein